MTRKVRYSVAGVTEAPAQAALRIRTRIRCSAADSAVLEALACYVSQLQGQDLAARCAAGLAHDTAAWAERKRALTRQCSSRFARWITKSSSDAYATARRNQRRALAATVQAIAVIEDKLRRPVRPPAARKTLHQAEAAAARAEGRRPRRLVFGYRSQSEHAAKRQRLQHLRAARDRLQLDVQAGRVHITRACFSYRTGDWLEQVQANRAVADDIFLDPRGRAYLDASFTPASPPPVPGLAALLGDRGLRVLALDLNHGFLAPAVLDRSGNPVARLDHIPLVTENLPASTRDGHLRAAITAVLDLAQAHGCALVAVENLGFDQMRAAGRERYGSRKRFRKIVCGIPTAQFRDRLAAMAARRGIAVAGVPAAYSSIWGRAHWQDPLSTRQHKVSGHTAAAVVLGRRRHGRWSP